MPVRSTTYYATPGTFSITAFELAYVTILAVKREGTGYNITTATPGNREVEYTAGAGKLEFENEFAAEKVFVLYKY